MSKAQSRGFTLIELLVVVAIIVILLAILIPGLEKALKASERARCGTNQRGIAQSLVQYALENDRTFVPAKNNAGTAAATALDVRNNTGAANANPAQMAAAAVGIGHLMVNGRLPSQKGGEIIHCPSLDTSSANPANYGMDNTANGVSMWQADVVIRSSYNYRGLSYGTTHSGSTIRINIANSGFVLTSDTISTDTDGFKYGRDFHHVTGWNVSYGDGHVAFFTDPEPLKYTAVAPQYRNTAAPNPSSGFVEGVVIGGENNGYKGPTGFTNELPGVEINGVVKPGADEAVYKYFSTGSR